MNASFLALGVMKASFTALRSVHGQQVEVAGGSMSATHAAPTPAAAAETFGLPVATERPSDAGRDARPSRPEMGEDVGP
jgi:hypothetical protein